MNGGSWSAMGPGGGPGRGMGRGRHGRPTGGHRHDDHESSARLDVRRVVQYLRPYRFMVFAALGAAGASTILGLLPPRLVGLIIDRALAGGETRLLYALAFALLGAHVLVNILNGLRSWFEGRLGQRVTYDLWRDLYGNLQRLSFSFYEKNPTGSLMSRITNDVSSVERFMVDGVNIILMASLTLVGITFILFWLNWRMALAAVVPIPLLVLLAWLVSRRAHRIFREVRRKMGDISALIQDSISGIREVKSFGREEYEIERFCEKSSDYMASNLEAVRLFALFFPAIMSTTALGTFLVLLTGGTAAAQTGSPTPGEIVSFLFYIGLFYQPIQQLNRVNHQLQHARASSERIFEIIDARPQIREAPDAVPLARPVRGAVTCEDVFFSYEPGSEVLRGISFEARPGEMIALVGPTGAGKTTIVSLLPRFYEPQAGRITLDGLDVRRLKLADLRANIGIVMQEPFLFNGTIRENIAYARPEAADSEIEAVARTANAHRFIDALPDGYGQEVGERGIKLSTGEKQRIAIARALLKDPPLLILDEATASVDTRTEQLIQEAIEKLLANRTTFVIAHRLSTVVRADRILVVRDGRIVESGKHESLLAAGGLYARLCRTQWRGSGSPAAPASGSG